MCQAPTAVDPCCPPQKTSDWSMLKTSRPSWYLKTAGLLRPCLSYLIPQLLHSRVHQAATPGKAVQRDNQGEQAYLCSRPSTRNLCLSQNKSTAPAMFTGKSEEQAGPNICLLALHLQQEWDHEANAHLGSITILPQSNRKVWWSRNMCKTGQPHRWQARISYRTGGSSCPYDSGKAVCPCNNLAHNHPEVAAEWDWEASVNRTPENVAAFSGIVAAWRCGLCGHRWSATVFDRKKLQGTGCPQCGREASRIQTRQPSISTGARHLLAEWDWEANETHGWHPDRVTLGSAKQVHWVLRDECKLGLVHRWQAEPIYRTAKNSGSPFPSGKSVCACNSLAVQCPEAADLWEISSNGGLTPGDVTVQSCKVVAWKSPDGRQWQQRTDEVVITVRRHLLKAAVAAYKNLL